MESNELTMIHFLILDSSLFLDKVVLLHSPLFLDCAPPLLKVLPSFLDCAPPLLKVLSTARYSATQAGN